jgi:hypothetical protein
MIDLLQTFAILLLLYKQFRPEKSKPEPQQPRQPEPTEKEKPAHKVLACGGRFREVGDGEFEL